MSKIKHPVESDYSFQKQPLFPVFVGVIGEKNSGKSTIIKSLTGCPCSNFRNRIIALNRARPSIFRNIEVLCSSPQEIPLGPALKAPFTALQRHSQQISNFRTLLQRAAGSSFNGLVSAIQPTNPRVRISMDEMFGLAIAMGFQCHAFILNPGNRKDSGAPIPEVRQRLIISGVSPRHISIVDARKFAIINAQMIRRRSSII